MTEECKLSFLPSFCYNPLESGLEGLIEGITRGLGRQAPAWGCGGAGPWWGQWEGPVSGTWVRYLQSCSCSCPAPLASSSAHTHISVSAAGSALGQSAGDT